MYHITILHKIIFIGKCVQYYLFIIMMKQYNINILT